MVSQSGFLRNAGRDLVEKQTLATQDSRAAG
jgi:hypothetical protein